MAESFKEAINHARLGKGPAIIEATCNRFRGHYEGDTDHYRTNQDKKEMMKITKTKKIMQMNSQKIKKKLLYMTEIYLPKK